MGDGAWRVNARCLGTAQPEWEFLVPAGVGVGSGSKSKGECTAYWLLRPGIKPAATAWVTKSVSTLGNTVSGVGLASDWGWGWGWAAASVSMLENMAGDVGHVRLRVGMASNGVRGWELKFLISIPNAKPLLAYLVALLGIPSILEYFTLPLVSTRLYIKKNPVGVARVVEQRGGHRRREAAVGRLGVAVLAPWSSRSGGIMWPRCGGLHHGDVAVLLLLVVWWWPVMWRPCGRGAVGACRLSQVAGRVICPCWAVHRVLVRGRRHDVAVIGSWGCGGGLVSGVWGGACDAPGSSPLLGVRWSPVSWWAVVTGTVGAGVPGAVGDAGAVGGAGAVAVTWRRRWWVWSPW
ncbi:hypothetical protein FPV67DRAFT_1447548 [Lyophyllum atratum]|nr:hypothetical protein FPV67DRAFT_1447548 [Lyophyllum atratum]